MQVDVPGKVRNASLAANNALLPLCEVVINSLEAIEDATEENGHIDIRIERDTSSLLHGDESGAADVIAFTIEDNGIGFDEAHFGAFQTADTTYNARRGGRGNARFQWLVAFERAVVESYFETASGMFYRGFEFIPEGSGIMNHRKESATRVSRATSVRLTGFRERYRRQCPKRCETIAARIIEHCLEYFIRPTCPTISLHDESLDEHMDLNERFADEILAHSDRASFSVNGNDFQIMHIRLRSALEKEHRVHFCADGRVVLSEKILGRIPNLARHIQDENGQEFTYSAYVTSALLNEQVNSERTGFALPDNVGELLTRDITWQDILIEVLNHCRDYLKPFTGAIAERKHERVQRFVETQAPQYRPILRYIGEDIEAIDPEIEDEQLDIKLYEAYQALQIRLRAEGQELLTREPGEEGDLQEFEARMQEYFEQVSDVNSSDLARYVCHRKAILEFLHHLLGMQDDGKYKYEDRVHSVIFPMGATSDEVLSESHNLWLVDEKLVYHRFLASDRQLRTMEPIETSSSREPDLVIFDAAWAFVASTDPPFPSVTILELKRPMRNDYTAADNPFLQVRRYIKDIREGRARTPDGRDIPVGEHIPFYCYIVCDITSSLDVWAKDYQLDSYPDRNGYFGYMKHYNAFINVISYTRLITDAKKRNAVFFQKLGLPSMIETSRDTAADNH